MKRQGGLSLPVFAICSSAFNPFSSPIGGTTTVQTAGLVSALEAGTSSVFWCVSSTKLLSANGLACPEESDVGEPSTVSQPLSCSSSDILQQERTHVSNTHFTWNDVQLNDIRAPANWEQTYSIISYLITTSSLVNNAFSINFLDSHVNSLFRLILCHQILQKQHFPG